MAKRELARWAAPVSLNVTTLLHVAVIHAEAISSNYDSQPVMFLTEIDLIVVITKKVVARHKNPHNYCVS
jgi:hypothetical protein